MNDKRLLQLEALMASDPSDPFLPYAIAQEFASAQKWDEAATRLEAIYGQFPDYLATYYQWGMALIHLNELSKAMDVLQKGYTLANRQDEKKVANEIGALIEELEDEL